MKRIWVNGIIILLITSICMAAYHRHCLAAVMKVNNNERLLVFAPHPDDEVLGCAGLMQRVRALGGRVGVVYLTAGDGCVSCNPFALVNGEKIHRNLGYRRISEALYAMDSLDISRDDMTFLGYPDRGLLPLWSMQGNPYQDYRSRKTGANYVFYQGLESQGLPYDYESLTRLLALTIDRFKPTIVLIPSTWDFHPDHRATNYFVKTALRNRRSSPRILSYLVHYKSWPVKSMEDSVYKKTHWPKGLPDNDYVLWLVPTEYQSKIQALKYFRSQHPSANHNFSSLSREEEIFWRDSLEIRDDPPKHGHYEDYGNARKDII